jgi:hypothetical protein
MLTDMNAVIAAECIIYAAAAAAAAAATFARHIGYAR